MFHCLKFMYTAVVISSFANNKASCMCSLNSNFELHSWNIRQQLSSHYTSCGRFCWFFVFQIGGCTGILVWSCRRVCIVSSYDVSNPVYVMSDVCINARMLFLGTAFSPGNNACDIPTVIAPAWQRTSTVSLAKIEDLLIIKYFHKQPTQSTG